MQGDTFYGFSLAANDAGLVYKVQAISADVDLSRALGIDPGLNNWLTCISNIGTSFIVDGLHLKALNQWYNKRVSVLKENQSQGFWSKQLAGITEICPNTHGKTERPYCSTVRTIRVAVCRNRRVVHLKSKFSRS
jgi:hypothetical protein